MEFARPLVPGRVLRRYKRFLADVELSDGRVVTAHCANPGSMMGLSDPGRDVWLEPNDDPKRKLKFTWRLVELPGGGMAGIDTGVPNKVVAEALAARLIPEFAGYDVIRPEQRYGRNSRIDFLLQAEGLPDAYVEVKNVHLEREAGLAEFPDSVTARGAKHLSDLADEVASGHRAVMLYVIQMTTPDRFDLARDIDPAYAKAFALATARGVEVLVWRCMLDTHRITLESPVPYVGPPGADPETAGVKPG
ncbi:MAG: DNA/RNA nuclease SfsA [Pseudomonadota bacterium]